MHNTWVIGNTGIGGEVFNQLKNENTVRQTGGTIMTGVEQVDACDADAVDRFIAIHGPFTEVVYCAGMQRLGFLGSTLNMMDAVDIYGANVLGFVNIMNVLAEQQPKEEPLSVVAVASDAAHVAMRGSILYCSSKAALVQAVKVAARELAPWRVNAVSPAVVGDTPMTDYIDRTVPTLRGWTPEQAREKELAAIPMGRRCTKEEVAATVISVLRGAEFMTGSNIEITGGK